MNNFLWQIEGRLPGSFEIAAYSPRDVRVSEEENQIFDKRREERGLSIDFRRPSLAIPS
jgi:hypothetical protein